VVVHIAGDIGVAPGLLSSLIVGRSGVRQSQRDRSRSQQDGFSRWKHVVAPLRISMRTNENKTTYPMRDARVFGIIRQKSEFGDSFVNVLFRSRQTTEKRNRTPGSFCFEFFYQLLDWQVTD
jgi:hypothetical protein